MTKWNAQVRERRMLFAGTLIIATLLIAIRMMPGSMTWRQEAAEVLGDAHLEAARVRASLATLSATLDSLQDRRSRVAAASAVLLPGTTYTSGAAAAAARLSLLASTSGVKVGAIEAETDTTSTGHFAHIRLRADMEGDIRGIAAILAAMEMGNPKLILDNWSVVRRDGPLASEASPLIRLEVTARALMRNPVVRSQL